MKIGCSILSFGAMPFNKVCKTAKQIGLEYIEVANLNYPSYPWGYPYFSLNTGRVKFRERVRGYGLKISGLSAHGEFIIYPKECLRHMKRAVKFAGETGIPIVNFGEGWLPRQGARRGKKVTEEEAFQTCTEIISQTLAEAEKYGVYLGVEPHGLFSSTIEGMKKIQAISPSNYLAVNYDTAVSVKYGFNFLKAFLDKVKHVHLKDFVRRRGVSETVAIGSGDVNIKGIIDVLKEAGYYGVLSIELWDPWTMDDPIESIKQSIEYLRSVV